MNAVRNIRLSGFLFLRFIPSPRKDLRLFVFRRFFPDYLTNDILRRIVHAKINSADILPNHAEHQHQHSADKNKHAHQRGETGLDINQYQFLDNRVNSVKKTGACAGTSDKCGNP